MAQKDRHNELRLILPDADRKSLRRLTKANEHPGGMSGLALEFIQQGLGKRKLGDYVHEETHQQVGAKKDREIAGLKKQADEVAAIWGDVVIELGMQDDLLEKVKNIPAWCLERVDFITGALNTATEKNDAYEKQIAEFKESTILRTEHEQRVDTVSKEKQELQTQLQAKTESVKRLNVKITEQESEINKLKTETESHNETIVSLRESVERHRDNQNKWIHLYIQEYRKPFWRKLLDSLMGRPDLPEEKDTEAVESPPKETPPENKPTDDIPF